MTRFLLLTILFVDLMSATALADHLYYVPNCCGDNFGYVSHMNGHPLVLSGGTDPFFFGIGGYPSGWTLGGETQLYLYSTVVWIDGVPTEFFFPPGTLFMTPFTLPTNGKDFRVPVGISFSISGFNFDTGQTIDLGGGAGGSISFYFSEPTGLYFAGDFVQAPEPGTLGFMATGLMGIAALARKRFNIGQHFRDRVSR